MNMDNAVLAYSLLERKGFMLHCLPHLRFLRPSPALKDLRPFRQDPEQHQHVKFWFSCLARDHYSLGLVGVPDQCATANMTQHESKSMIALLWQVLYQKGAL